MPSEQSHEAIIQAAAIQCGVSLAEFSALAKKMAANPDPYPNLIRIDNNLAAGKITALRDRNTDTEDYRNLVNELGLILCAEITRELPMKDVQVTTSTGETTGKTIDGKIVVMPILRAGLAIGKTFNELMPDAQTGHIGLAKLKGHEEPVKYIVSIPGGNRKKQIFMVLDIEIATGKTMSAAVDQLLNQKIPAEQIRVATIIAAQPGIENFYADPLHAEVQLYTMAIDPALTADNRPIPGIGNTGSILYPGV